MRPQKIMNQSAKSISKARPVLEPMEERCFKSVSSWSDSNIAGFSGDYFATALYGDNGDMWGVPTGAAGQGDDWDAWSYMQWDSNTSDGIDSGWHDVQLSINADGAGTGTWAENDETPQTFSVGTSTTIQSVIVQAAVASSGMEMDWSNLTIKFYNNGNLVETVSPANAPNASTMTANNGNPAESVMVVTPSATNDNGVAISGAVRLKATAGNYPMETDIFGQITINAH
jgi:hypothetical protein